MAKHSVLKRCLIAGLALGVLLPGCATTPFFFPITDQERQQILALRAFRTAISPESNRAMRISQRDLLMVLSLKLPSEYGVDLSPYFIPLPKVAIPNPPPGFIQNIDQAKQFNGVSVPTNNLFMTAQALSSGQGASESWQYLLTMQPTLLGQAGTMKVTTSGAQWQSNITAGTSTKPYYFGQRYTRLPSSVSLQAELTLQQSAGKATLNASLGSFQEDPAGSDLKLPQSVSFDGSLPGLSWNLNGMMSTTTAMTIQGSLTVQGNQGTDSYMVEGRTVNGDVNVRLLNEEKGIDLTLDFREGSLKGQAKSRVDRRFVLADIASTKEGRVTIKYGDGSQEVLF